ncbi:MAG: hypothetical protein ISS28_01280 [Candidatus Cloacimonetes bacterium]|nr:hypothetical protein [Candidatus Cloacimonadota bacterium]
MFDGGLIVFGLSKRDTDRVMTYLVCKGLLWGQPGIIHDPETEILMTDTEKAKQVVMNVLRDLNLLPQEETVLLDAV